MLGEVLGSLLVAELIEHIFQVLAASFQAVQIEGFEWCDDLEFIGNHRIHPLSLKI